MPMALEYKLNEVLMSTRNSTRWSGHSPKPSMFARAISGRMGEMNLSTNALYELVKEDGVTRSGLFHFMRGERNLKMEQLEAICRVLDLTLSVKGRRR